MRLHGSPSRTSVARMAALASVAGGPRARHPAGRRRPATPDAFGPMTVAPMMLCGLVTFGGAEFVREDLRKPYVLSQTMFVNGVRLGPGLDPFSIAQLNATWRARLGRLRAATAADLCRPTILGLAARRRRGGGACCARRAIRGRLPGAAAARHRTHRRRPRVHLARLAVPLDARASRDVGSPHARLNTWRGRLMPTVHRHPAERHALGGLPGDAGRRDPRTARSRTRRRPTLAAALRRQLRHVSWRRGEWPFAGRPPRSADAFDEMLGRLPRSPT